MDEQAVTFYQRFGHLVKQNRNQMGINQLQLAEMVGVTRTTITHVENGKWNIALHKAYALTKILDIPFETVQEIYLKVKLETEYKNLPESLKSVIRAIP